MDWRVNYTRWFKYDRDKLWLVYTQIVPVIFEPPCTLHPILASPWSLLPHNKTSRLIWLENGCKNYKQLINAPCELKRWFTCCQQVVPKIGTGRPVVKSAVSSQLEKPRQLRMMWRIWTQLSCRQKILFQNYPLKIEMQDLLSSDLITGRERERERAYGPRVTWCHNLCHRALRFACEPCVHATCSLLHDSSWILIRIMVTFLANASDGCLKYQCVCFSLLWNLEMKHSH